MPDPIKRQLEKGMKILFQGDSITDADRSRNKDWNHMMGHGYAYLIASRLWYDHPDKMLKFYNRGISGNKITDLSERWKEDAIDHQPGILSILIGVNDAVSFLYGDDRYSSGNFKKVYHFMLMQTREKLPDTLLVLCEPFLLPVFGLNEDWGLWETEIHKRQEIVSNLAAEFQAVLVSLQEPFNQACKKAPADYWASDGVHPMPAGHELIAREWIKKVSRTVSL